VLNRPDLGCRTHWRVSKKTTVSYNNGIHAEDVARPLLRNGQKGQPKFECTYIDGSNIIVQAINMSASTLEK
jgi:hypothetical protein